jgi:hypothetical protein
MAKPTRAQLFENYLSREGMTGPLAALARSIYGQESGSGANTTTSNAGAVGGMQVIKPTFDAMADPGWDINDNEHNSRAGLRYIKHLNELSGGNHGLTAVGYYGGPGAMNKARNGEAVSDPRNPNAPDTIRYSDEVLGRMPDNAGYARVARTPVAMSSMREPVATAYPVSAPADTQGIPLEIPAYFGRPDRWSNFGRALPRPQVRPSDLNYGESAAENDMRDPRINVESQPLMPQMVSQYMPKTNQPNMDAFKAWGSHMGMSLAG